MEPIEYSKLATLLKATLGRLIEKMACKLGDHSYEWKLEKGETISIDGPPPDRAKCHYCRKTFGEINSARRK